MRNLSYDGLSEQIIIREINSRFDLSASEVLKQHSRNSINAAFILSKFLRYSESKKL